MFQVYCRSLDDMYYHYHSTAIEAEGEQDNVVDYTSHDEGSRWGHHNWSDSFDLYVDGKLYFGTSIS